MERKCQQQGAIEIENDLDPYIFFITQTLSTEDDVIKLRIQ